MWFNNLANSFLAFVTIFFVVPTIAFGPPSRELHALLWSDATTAAAGAFVLIALWACVGLLTRLDRVRRQPANTLSHDQAVALLVPLAAPGVSGLLVVAAFCIGRPATVAMGLSYWASIIVLAVGAVALMSLVILRQKAIEVTA